MHRHLDSLIELGNKMMLMSKDEDLLKKVKEENPWFTIDFVKDSLLSWSLSLTLENLSKWTNNYELDKVSIPKKIGIICAGNLPLVGLHDIICAYISGNEVYYKPSSDDHILCKKVVDALSKIDSKSSMHLVEKMNGVEAIIATGNNNTQRYFDYYFRDIPRILRGSRTSVSVITEDITTNELNLLSNDIFQYFGRGCRSVTHLFLPHNFDIQRIFESWFHWGYILNHNKYSSNFNYQRALLMLNGIQFLENNFAIMTESLALKPPTGIVNYSFYQNQEDLNLKLESIENQIQTVVGRNFQTSFGNSQKPNLWDYADGEDNLSFCLNL